MAPKIRGLLTAALVALLPALAHAQTLNSLAGVTISTPASGQAAQNFSYSCSVSGCASGTVVAAFAPTQGNALLSATNGLYTNLLQANGALSATNGLYTNLLQGNAALSATNPIFVSPATSSTWAATQSGTWTVGPTTATAWGLFADNAAWTAGTSVGATMGCEYTSGGATALTTGHSGAPACTSARAVFTDKSSVAGTALGAAVSALGTAASGTPNVENVNAYIVGGGGSGGTSSSFSATFPSTGTAAGAEYLSSAPTLTTGQMVALQTDVNGNLKVYLNGCATGGSPCNSNGSATSANSSPVVIASDQAAVAVKGNAANGAAVSGNPNLIAGSDGTDARTIATNASGQPVVVGAGTAGTANSGVMTVQGIASMTPLLANPGTAANWGVGATGSAVPANAQLSGAVSSGNLTGIIQADNSAPVNISTATTTQIVGLVSGKKIYVLNYALIAGAADNVTFEYGTGTNCATGTTALSGALPIAANGGATDGGGLGPILIVPAGNALCILTSAAVQLSGHLAYTQF